MVSTIAWDEDRDDLAILRSNPAMDALPELQCQSVTCRGEGMGNLKNIGKVRFWTAINRNFEFS